MDIAFIFPIYKKDENPLIFDALVYCIMQKNLNPFISTLLTWKATLHNDIHYSLYLLDNFNLLNLKRFKMWDIQKWNDVCQQISIMENYSFKFVFVIPLYPNVNLDKSQYQRCKISLYRKSRTEVGLHKFVLR